MTQPQGNQPRHTRRQGKSFDGRLEITKAQLDELQYFQPLMLHFPNRKLGKLRKDYNLGPQENGATE